MKAILFSAALCATLSTTVFAQQLQEAQSTVQMQAIRPDMNNQVQMPSLSPEEKAKKQAMKLKTKLNLTDEQYGKVASILTGTHVKRQELENATSDIRERRSQLKALKTQTDEQLKAVFTKEQTLKFGQMMQSRQAHPRGRGKGKHKTNPLNSNLDLPELQGE